jgi:DNA-binding transcriptional ArsR family regulator
MLPFGHLLMVSQMDNRARQRRSNRSPKPELAVSGGPANDPDGRPYGVPEDRDELLQLVFRALADPTRRKILDLIKHRPLTTGALCGEFTELTRFAVMKHLKVLERASLVVVRRSGRERHNYLNHVPIRMVYERWMGPYAELWSSSLLRLKDHVEDRRGERG